MTPNNLCKKCGDDLEGCKCGQHESALADGLSAAKQQFDQLTHHQTGSTESAHGTTTMSDLQQQLDELKRNIERELSRRVKNTFESNTQLKLEVRNLRAELTDLRASNKAVTGERDKIHGQLVEVRSALADVSAERDSLRTTLASWEAADTAPFVKVPDVADHVMPPALDRGEPDPANDERDAKLEFRNVVPTPEMIAYVQWWDVPEGNTSICFKHWTQKPVVWRRAGDNGDERWQYENCPQPLKPHGMTWQQVDEYLASKKTMWTPSLAPTPAAERELLPLCDKCHTCGMTLEMRPGKIACRATLCRSNVSKTVMWDYDVCDIAHPYHEPCRSRQPVRHE